MAPASISGIDSPRIGGTLSDVPEEGTLTPAGRGSPRSGSPYIHPSLSGSASTFKAAAPAASTSSLVSISSSRPPTGPRHPSALRTSSASSIAHSDVSSSANTPGTPTTATSNGAAALTKKTRSKSPMGSIREREKDRDTKDNQTPSKNSKSAAAAATAAHQTNTRLRTTPHLPHAKEVEIAPATLMYWSRAPVYGAMPTHGMRAHSVTLIDSTAWIFGGCDEKGCWKDAWNFNTETMQWSHPEMLGDVPPPCRAHTATLVDRRLVIFGGGEGSVYRNNIYILDTTTRRWSAPTFPETMPIPPPRRAHTAVLYRNKIWIFGGGNGTQALNDLWTLDVGSNASNPDKMKWEMLQTRGRKPTARGYHTANLIGNVMIIMGGSDGRECFSDIWCLNLDTLFWSQVKLDVVHRRLSHTATQVGSYLFIWGGHDGTQYTSDLLLFNLVSLTFETRPIAGKAPSARGYHTALIADSRLFIFGGFNGNEVFDDVYNLDLAGAAYLPQVTSFKIDVD